MHRRVVLTRPLYLMGLSAAFVAIAPAPALAVEVVALSDLSTRSDSGMVTIPIYDAGFPSSGLPRVTTELGKVHEVTPADGVALVKWSPPSDFEGGSVPFRVRYKEPSGAKVDTTFAIQVPASPSRPIEVSATPAVAAPDVRTVQLRFKAPASGQHPADRQFVLSASFGEVGPVTVDAQGVATATWTRPEAVTQPTMALIAVVDKVDPRRRGRMELPVQISQSTTFEVPPDATVSVQLGDETIGPMQASPAGTVAFDLRLDPRVNEGRLVGRTPYGDSVDETVPLPNSAEPVLLFAPVPHPARVGRPAASIPVAVATWTPPGAAPLKPTLQASVGSLEAVAEQPEHWHIGHYSPAPGTTDAQLTVVADGVQTQTTVAVRTGMLRVQSEVDPEALEGATRELRFSARALAPDNREVEDTVGLVVAQGSLTARPARRGTVTSARARIDANADTVALLAEPPGSVRSQPVHSVLPWLVPIDKDTVVLRVAVTDPLGRAIVNQPVQLSTICGTVNGLPTEATTDGYGMVHLPLPRPEGVYSVEARSGGMSGAAAHSPNGTAVSGGDSEWARTLAEWQSAAPVSLVTRKAAPVVAAAPAAPNSAPARSPQPPAAAPATPPSTASATAPARPATPARPAAPRAAHSSGPVTLRAAVAGQLGSFLLTTEQSSGEVGPLTAAREDDGLNTVGLQAFVLSWPNDGALGLELDGRFQQTDFASAQTFASPFDFTDLEELEGLDAEAAAAAVAEASTATLPYELQRWEVRAGLRYRVGMGEQLQGYGLVHAHRQAAELFLWEDGEVTPTEVALYGGRIGGGLIWEQDQLWVDLQAAETLVPYPIRHEAELRAHYLLSPGLALHAGVGKYWRNMTFEVDGSDITFHDEQAYVSVGVGTARR